MTSKHETKSASFHHSIDSQGSQEIIVEADPKKYMGLSIRTATFGSLDGDAPLELGKKGALRLAWILTDLAEHLPDEPEGDNYKGAILE